MLKQKSKKYLEEAGSQGFTNNVSPMVIAEDLILESLEFKKYMEEKGDRWQAVKQCLHDLGMKVSDVMMHRTIVRCSGNKRVGYLGNIYIGYTRPSFKYKHLYDTVQILSPEKPPEDKKPIDLEKLGEKSRDRSKVSVKQLKKDQSKDLSSTKTTNVKEKKPFSPMDVDKFIGRRNK